jgi:hypothetical protein
MPYKIAEATKIVSPDSPHKLGKSCQSAPEGSGTSGAAFSAQARVEFFRFKLLLRRF